MNFEFEQHTSEELLERYALGRLDEADTVILEEHLLICDQCRAQLDDADNYVHAMQLGAARLRRVQSKKRFGSAWDSIPAAVRWLFQMPAVGWAAVATAVLVAAVRLPYPSPNLAKSHNPVPVALVADRGEVISAPAHHILDLKMDARGLDLGSKARVELVNAQGKTIETLSAPEIAEKIAVRTSRDLTAGYYYVRVYAPGTLEMVREFGLDVK